MMTRLRKSSIKEEKKYPLKFRTENLYYLITPESTYLLCERFQNIKRDKDTSVSNQPFCSVHFLHMNEMHLHPTSMKCNRYIHRWLQLLRHAAEMMRCSIHHYDQGKCFLFRKRLKSWSWRHRTLQLNVKGLKTELTRRQYSNQPTTEPKIIGNLVNLSWTRSYNF